MDRTDESSPHSSYRPGPWAPERARRPTSGGAALLFAAGLALGANAPTAGIDVATCCAAGALADTGFTALPAQEVVLQTVEPGAAAPGSRLSITIRGTGFNPQSVISIRPGVRVDSTRFERDGQLRVWIRIDPDARPGPRDVVHTFRLTPSATRLAVPPPAVLGAGFTVLGRGEEPLRVPPVVGEPVGEAERLIAEAGLPLGPVEEEPSDAPAGIVTRQEPDGGARVAPGTPVTLRVSRGQAGSQLGGIEPAAAAAGSEIEAVLRGTGFNRTSQVRIDDVDVTSVELVSPQELRLSLRVPRDAIPGTRDVIHVTPGGPPAVLQSGFTIQQPLSNGRGWGILPWFTLAAALIGVGAILLAVRLRPRPSPESKQPGTASRRVPRPEPPPGPPTPARGGKGGQGPPDVRREPPEPGERGEGAAPPPPVERVEGAAPPPPPRERGEVVEETTAIAPSGTRCPACGEPVHATFLVCPACGERLRSAPTGAAPPPGERGEGAAPPRPPGDRGEEAEPPPAADAGAEDSPPVRFTAFHPKETAPDRWTSLLVYVHVPAAEPDIVADSRARLEERIAQYGAGAAEATRAISRGAEVRIVPELAGFQFNPATARLLWLEDWHCVEFRMRATADTPGFAPGTAVNGRISFFVGPILIGELPIWTYLGSAAEEAAGAGPARTSADPFRRIFPSYSHDDTEIVNRLKLAYRAIGDEFMQDIEVLRSGEDWSAALLERIDKADVFQLFWSDTASQSRYVEQEWRRALKRDVPNFIRPVYWRRPLPTVPPELRRIHFRFEELT